MIAPDNLSNENEMNSDMQKMNSFNSGENYEHIGKEQHETGYHCPMNCEGNKTYNQAGECPVCNMQLVSAGNDDPNIMLK